jgi:hypothetical protein
MSPAPILPAHPLAKSSDAIVIVAGYDFLDEGEYTPAVPIPADRGTAKICIFTRTT